MNKRCLVITGFILLVALAEGCGEDTEGPQMVDVTGVVTYKQQPVSYGQVILIGAQGPPSPPAALNEDGTFSTQALPGRLKVVVNAIPPAEGGQPDPLSEGGIDYSHAKPAKSLVPLKYSRPETSDVEVTVTNKGPNQLVIALE